MRARFAKIANEIAEQQMAEMLENTHSIVKVCFVGDKIVSGIEVRPLVEKLPAGTSVEVLQGVQVALQRMIDGIRMGEKAKMRSPGQES
jgi:hypothetical protein